jgi:hypothetical protein
MTTIITMTETDIIIKKNGSYPGTTRT